MPRDARWADVLVSFIGILFGSFLLWFSKNWIETATGAVMLIGAAWVIWRAKDPLLVACYKDKTYIRGKGFVPNERIEGIGAEHLTLIWWGDEVFWEQIVLRVKIRSENNAVVKTVEFPSGFQTTIDPLSIEKMIS